MIQCNYPKIVLSSRVKNNRRDFFSDFFREFYFTGDLSWFIIQHLALTVHTNLMAGELAFFLLLGNIKETLSPNLSSENIIPLLPSSVLMPYFSIQVSTFIFKTKETSPWWLVHLFYLRLRRKRNAWKWPDFEELPYRNTGFWNKSSSLATLIKVMALSLYHWYILRDFWPLHQKAKWYKYCELMFVRKALREK